MKSSLGLKTSLALRSKTGKPDPHGAQIIISRGGICRPGIRYRLFKGIPLLVAEYPSSAVEVLIIPIAVRIGDNDLSCGERAVDELTVAEENSNMVDP